jgi:hypothetical protein
MRAFGGRPLTALVDPKRASPAALEVLAQRAGASLLTSLYLQRHESLRILTWLATRATLDPANAPAHRRRLEDWLARLGSPAQAKSA